MTLPGLGEFRVLTLREDCGPLAIADTPDTAFKYWNEKVVTDPRYNPDVESMYVLVLTCRRTVQGHYLVAQGSLSMLLAHAREVFRAAIVANAAAIICMHNHPSGDPTPSEADIKVTRDLIRAGQLLKIDLLDHMVVANGMGSEPATFKSLREQGYFYT
jgi:DNA repair protein RadC